MAGGILRNTLTGHAVNLMARSDTCKTAVCKDTAKAILHDMNVNIDPCTDFYQYTCGGWVADSQIPDSESSVGTFTDLRNNNLDGLCSILAGSYDDLLKGVQANKTSDHAFLNPDQVDGDRNNFNKIKNYYESCMDENTIDALGPTPVYPEINALLATLGYNSEYEDTRFTFENVHQLTDALIYLSSDDVEHLFSYDIGPDDHNPEEYVINLNQPGLGLPSREYYQQPEVIANYRAGLVSIMSAVLGDAQNDDANENTRRQKMTESNLSMMSQQEIESMIDRFIDFETNLANISLPNDQFQNPVELYNPMTIAELHQHYPFVDWIKFIRHFTPEDVSLPDKVIVIAPNFFSALSDWLSNSATRDNGVTTQSLREFFVVKTIMSNISNLDRNTRELSRNMYSKISSGTTAPPNRSRVCINHTSNNFGQLLGRYFVMSKFGGEAQRKQFDSFINNIKSSWTGILNNANWLDMETKDKALEKLQLLNQKEAYSTANPDDRSPESLGKYYGSIMVDPKSFYTNQKSAQQWGFNKSWNKLGKKVDKDEWFMVPHEVNAYYSPGFNEIAIPAGILQSPFYHHKLPNYLNYGGIGVVVGHELTHAFDNSGRLYDGTGRLNTWWTDATTNAFEDKSKCFINQYSKFSVVGTNNESINVNGKMTLGENLADNGGLNAAHMSMRKSFSEDPEENKLLPGLDHLSPEQLFFINFGRVWCSSMRPELALQRVRNDVHSPARARVNGAVQNNKEFAAAFQCSDKTAMNPVDKCNIW